MRPYVLAGVISAVCSCDGSSNLELRNTSAPDDGLTRLPVEPVSQGSAVPTLEPVAIPPGSPFLPLLAGHRVAVRGSLAVVSDPEGQGADGHAPRLWIANVDTGEVRSVDLPDGARPGAVELTANGYAWVVLEGSGGIAAVDTRAGKVTRFVPVCRAPVDLAFGGTDVWVACLSGEVVRVAGATSTTYTLNGVPTRIAAAGERIQVALSDATLVTIDVGGLHELGRPAPTSLTPNHMPNVPRTAKANSPRRIVPIGGTAFAVLHQQSVEGELTNPETPAAPASPYSGGPPTPSTCPTPATRPVVTTTDDDAPASQRVRPSRFFAATLPIDLSASPIAPTLAVADAATGRINLFRTLSAPGVTPAGCPKPDLPVKSMQVTGVSSVAYAEDGRLVALSSALTLSLSTFDLDGNLLGTVHLRSRSVPVGFELFHASPKPSAPAEPNVSCATCHPAGLNNGGTLTVRGVTRKVMTLGSHLAGAPGVHWDNQPFQVAVIDGTWKTNMQGRALTAIEASSLKSFVEQLQLPPAPAIDAERARAGRIAFGKAACGGCHDPSRGYTNNSQANVGRGVHRVPSLVGLAYSSPYMADGCAKTLEERFTKTACGGGEQHGHPALLSTDELSDLIAFLKTL